ncbi:hypothetical protein PSEUBRA_004986 [Kalmanozyma brasiliensis GHG001]|uniref:BTB domain-containing protein n=1 Tax=Kalmanozyma brasiliensis (strain GHG001) TaxID=1365824 RepID=V5GIX8_KALBG|nr:uncharacterized protein PSEUBRA_004986 [Kalmanozyma brasiliensis GHG001]EST05937.1 hypothetical protein PSEUBRA_004986 [Kalmanozyma brasiliensis GHG001]
MMMSPALSRHHHSSFSAAPSSSRAAASSRSSLLDTKTTASPGKPSPRTCAVDVAVKQLGLGENIVVASSSSRPLQPIDTNISKTARQQASSSRAQTPSSSPKLGGRSSPSKKTRSPSSKDISAGVRSAAKASKVGSIFSSSASVTLKGERISVKVPQRLPTPRLKPNSSPYEDLSAHLSRHHFFTEAHDADRHSITPDFFLETYLETARLGKCSLYHQTESFLNANKAFIMTKEIPGQPLPETVPLDVTEWLDSLQRPPTHLLAVHSDNEAATLYAVHGPVLALQCVSIPFFPASKETQENGITTKHMPTLALRVPSVQHFNTILRWFYSQSTISLLHELLPLKHILTYLTKRSLAHRNADAAPVDIARLSQVDLVEAMSTLSTKAFLGRLQTIQAVWKNGVALGIVSSNFWSALDNAWNLIIAGMIASSKRKAQIHKVVASVVSGDAVATAKANELTQQLQSTKLE